MNKSDVETSFWHGKRVLVTGHTGFKGSWLCLWLQEMGAEVSGIALAEHFDPSLFEDAGVAAGMTSYEGDVRYLERVREVLETAQPEIVIHMAAQSLVRESYADPVGTYATNVMGTVNVLEAARATPSVRVVINVTSDKCYENREHPDVAYVETDPMGGYDPYSSSKASSELVSAAYRRSFFSQEGAPRLASARAGNVIGGGDWAPDRLVPDLVRNALNGVPTSLRNPGSVRPWQHVLNPLSGYLVLAQHLWTDASFAEAWNFGPSQDEVKTVADVADKLHELWPEIRWESSEDESHPHEAGLLRVDSKKARTRLGWAPKWALGETLERTAIWYSAYASKSDVRKMTLQQIQDFAAS